MMNDWYQRMVATLQLNGKGERTQQAYTRSVRMLSQFYDKTPDLISEPELQEYFLHRKNVNRWAPKAMRICYYREGCDASSPMYAHSAPRSVWPAPEQPPLARESR